MDSSTSSDQLTSAYAAAAAAWMARYAACGSHEAWVRAADAEELAIEAVQQVHAAYRAAQKSAGVEPTRETRYDVTAKIAVQRVAIAKAALRQARIARRNGTAGADTAYRIAQDMMLSALDSHRVARFNAALYAPREMHVGSHNLPGGRRITADTTDEQIKQIVSHHADEAAEHDWVLVGHEAALREHRDSLREGRSLAEAAR